MNQQDALLTLNLLKWKIWWAPNNASRWQMGFNSACKGLIYFNNKHLHVSSRFAAHQQGNKLCINISWCSHEMCHLVVGRNGMRLRGI